MKYRKYALVVVVVISLIALAGLAFQLSDPSCSRNIKYPYADRYNDDPAVRAGSIHLISDDASEMGFLYQQDGQFYIGTVGRVITERCVYAFFPGLDQGFVFKAKDIKQTDGFLSIAIDNEALIAKLETAVKDGILLPYELSNEAPEVNDAVVIPGPVDGIWIPYVVKEISDKELVIKTTGAFGVLCKGSGGHPVVKATDYGRPTNEVVGVVSYGVEPIQYGNYLCSTSVGVLRP